MSKALVPESKQGLSAFKNEVAAEMGLSFKKEKSYIRVEILW